MSKVFFEELEMPVPDFYLGINGGSHAEQVARIMIEFEKVLLNEKPDLIIVPGDVNSTMACVLVAAKLGIKIAHVESGLRNFDRSMPEEINRIVTDVLSDYLFVSEQSGLTNLRNEGIAEGKIFFTGNVMIDSLVYYMSGIESSLIHQSYSIEKQNCILVTFHRPGNVDDKQDLIKLIDFLNELTLLKKVIFPVHPRTSNNLRQYNLQNKLTKNVLLTDPIGYIDFLKLEKDASLVLTDSGGIQEETTWLGVQCITVCNNTERPITVLQGTNQLIGTDYRAVLKVACRIINGDIKKGTKPELWDGKTAERIVEIITLSL